VADPSETSAQAETTASVQRGKQDEITMFLQPDFRPGHAFTIAGCP
jgi:hypothetical protein